MGCNYLIVKVVVFFLQVKIHLMGTETLNRPLEISHMTLSTPAVVKLDFLVHYFFLSDN